MTDHLSHLFDSMSTVVDEGFSYDGIVSVPATGLEDDVYRTGLSGWVDEGMHQIRTAISQAAARFSRRATDSKMGSLAPRRAPPISFESEQNGVQPLPHIDKEHTRGLPAEETMPRGINTEAPEGPPHPDIAQESPEEKGEQRLENPPHSDVDQDLPGRSGQGLEEITQYQCSRCGTDSKSSRNLAVFIDGTSNKPGDRSTNVMKLFSQIKEGSEPKQDRFYLNGIGVYDLDGLSALDRMGKTIYSSFEMALAWNEEKNVKTAYSLLVDVYQEGDRIYLFGFSRGAYQVRALATMIHEVGLVKKKHQIDSAYNHYLSIHTRNNAKTREKATEFKKLFCWPGVRIHFVGVWDTVSSLGLSKRDVHITASASAQNACHFRHALALDERRVKFMPEYFAEVNAHRNNTRSPKAANGDVKEVWFAGSHSDVGGTSRPHPEAVLQSVDNDRYPVHAGNAPLLWMRREAANNGLVFNPEEFCWDPVDVDFGRENSMTTVWKLLEFWPIRQQVSFSGTGKHERRLHRSRPRSVIPQHKIHSSVLSGDVYTSRATLVNGVDIPTVRCQSEDLDGLWTTERQDEASTTHLLKLLLSDQRKALGSLEKVLFLLNSRLDNKQTQTIPSPQWCRTMHLKQSDFARFALTVIYDVISDFSVPEELVGSAKNSLCAILSSTDRPYSVRAFYVLRFTTRHERLRQRFVADNPVLKALMLALDQTVNNVRENLFLLLADSIRYLLDDDDVRRKVVHQLIARHNGIKAGEIRLSLALEVKAPRQLVASLKLIGTSACHLIGEDLRRELVSKITKLAEEERRPIGSAAVEALVALKSPTTYGVHISNILGYLGNALPLLDIEVGSTSSLISTGDLELPFVLRVNGSGELDEKLMQKIVQTIESNDRRERTSATLTLLKLCRNSKIRQFCSENVVHIFQAQLERKKTSLLAAYALGSCLEQGMGARLDVDRAAQFIVAMIDRGWFDDAIGRIEGCEVFRGLMEFDDIRKGVTDHGIVDILMKKLEVGERHGVRMSLQCLDVLRINPLQLSRYVTQSIDNLPTTDKKTWKRGVKLLSTLAQTKAGEQAIADHVPKIVSMLLPSGGQPLPRAQLFGPTIVLYDLCKNETLQEKIRESQEYFAWVVQRPA